MAVHGHRSDGPRFKSLRMCNQLGTSMQNIMGQKDHHHRILLVSPVSLNITCLTLTLRRPQKHVRLANSYRRPLEFSTLGKDVHVSASHPVLRGLCGESLTVENSVEVAGFHKVDSFSVHEIRKEAQSRR